MANAEHLRILQQGVEAWNKWRKEKNPYDPDLSGADLSGANLSEAHLIGTDLSGAHLIGVDLRGADLSHAGLSHADLRRATLDSANLRGTGLDSASLSDANLTAANLTGTWLNNTSFTEAYLCQTNFTFTSLKTAKGLETCIHSGPSALDYHTLIESGPLPEVFLRGCGLSDDFIRYLPSFWSQPIQFSSCFISYSTQDEEFASRLHNDFQDKGIRCWKWDHDARTGRSLMGEIDEAIRVYDKLVLIASESSLKSPAVNREIERALVQEDERLKRKFAGDPNVDCDVLFPIRIDDFLIHGWKHERKVDVTKKVIADARGWDRDTAVYRRVLNKLVSDLKSESPNPRL